MAVHGPTQTKTQPICLPVRHGCEHLHTSDTDVTLQILPLLAHGPRHLLLYIPGNLSAPYPSSGLLTSLSGVYNLPTSSQLPSFPNLTRFRSLQPCDSFSNAPEPKPCPERSSLRYPHGLLFLFIRSLLKRHFFREGSSTALSKTVPHEFFMHYFLKINYIYLKP